MLIIKSLKEKTYASQNLLTIYVFKVRTDPKLLSMQSMNKTEAGVLNQNLRGFSVIGNVNHSRPKCLLTNIYHTQGM